ncbi:MAG: nitric oxide synthase oxygenase [Bacteroidota bacterium]
MNIATTIEKDTSREATEFLTQFYQETQKTELTKRLGEVHTAIAQTGTYELTQEELTFGAKLAWRNSNRCVGRLFWKTLKVLDFRHVRTKPAFLGAIRNHLIIADSGNKVRSVISIFPSQRPDIRPLFRIFNYTLIQYAGYQLDNGQIIGDPKHLEFTKFCQSLGWSGEGTHFDILPVVFQVRQQPIEYYELPKSLVTEVSIEHPTLDWVADLGLKWYKLPIVSNMKLSIGGIDFPTVPFNGWYMLNEIATRNFGDQNRYNLLPTIAQKMGCFKTSPFWKDKSLLVLNEAVYHSFQKANATIVDHHTASEQFMQFVEREQKFGRTVTGDWAWLVPPNASSTTAIYHYDWSNEVKTPNFFYQANSLQDISSNKQEKSISCPFLNATV